MARIFDNIEQELLGALRATLAVSTRADFCVGYLNLRGWKAVDDLIQPWVSTEGQVCRVLVGMQRPPHDEIRELIRLYMMRRTRSFIIQHYTQADDNGRHYLPGKDGARSYFPLRKPLSLQFAVDEADPLDRYAALYSEGVVDQINALHVPRYGLGLYVDPIADKAASAAERRVIENLGRAGKRLMRGGVNDEELGQAIKSLREEGRLTFADDDAALRERRVVCSMGLLTGAQA